MKTFLFIIMTYVLPIVIVRYLNKLSTKLFHEDLIDCVNVIEVYVPIYNILVAFVITLVFIGMLFFEIYDECEYRLGKVVDIDLIKDKLREFLK